MPKHGEIYRSLSDMELNLMEEAVKNGSEQETASSGGGDVGADIEEQGLRVGPNSVPDDQVGRGLGGWAGGRVRSGWLASLG